MDCVRNKQLIFIKKKVDPFCKVSLLGNCSDMRFIKSSSDMLKKLKIKSIEILLTNINQKIPGTSRVKNELEQPERVKSVRWLSKEPNSNKQLEWLLWLIGLKENLTVEEKLYVRGRDKPVRTTV